MRIRVVDFQSPTAAEEFTQGLKEIGFGVVANHPINNRLVEKVYADWGAFFKGSEAEKNQYTFDNKKHDGYISQNLSETAKGYDKKDLKEFYHYYTWGRCPDNLRQNTQDLSNQLTDMAKTLLSWVEYYAPKVATEHLTMP